MTNGDFAFFTFRPARSSGTDRPWTAYFEVSGDFPRRIRALYAFKQVRVYYYRSLTLLSCYKLHFLLYLLTVTLSYWVYTCVR